MGALKGQGRHTIGGPSEVTPRDLVGRFTLIVGETNRGKTALSRRCLNAYCRQTQGIVTVVDLAPSISSEDLGRGALAHGVGGKLHPPESHAIRYIHGRIHPPRLRARDEQEAQVLADENARIIESMFQQALRVESEALFINDCSLYLHAGDPHRMLGWIRSARTAVVNGYYGQSLGEGALSHREREGMAFLMEYCDRLIRL